jgi:hypothetical protein
MWRRIQLGALDLVARPTIVLSKDNRSKVAISLRFSISGVSGRGIPAGNCRYLPVPVCIAGVGLITYTVPSLSVPIVHLIPSY